MNESAPLMVGVSGLRGIVGKSLTPEVAARFAGAVGGWLGDRAAAGHGGGKRGEKTGRRPVVAIGRDGRTGGETIATAAIAGLLGSGCDVVDAGIAMTPSMGVLVDQLGVQAGLQVTASHNPQEWNGLKVLVCESGAKRGDPGACAPSAADAEDIVSRFKAGRIGLVTWDGVGSLETDHDAAEDVHWSTARDAIDQTPLAEAILKAKFRVALDCVGGSGGVFSPKFLSKVLKCKVTVSGEYIDGRFTHTPEPTRENLAGFSKVVKKARADVGFAQDPDADRLAIVDERGQYIGEEYTLALAAEALLGEGAKVRRHGGTKGERKKRDLVLVTNLSTSRMIEDVAARHGARVIRTAVGEANVVSTMKRFAREGSRVVLGGEGNGGVIWPEVTFIRDSLSAMALVLGLMARRKEPLSEIVASMPAYAIEKRKVDLARKEDAQPAVKKLAAAYSSHHLDLQDGIRIDFAGGPLEGKAWLHVRASNTEPIMRLIAEAPTSELARAVLDDAAKVIAAP